MLTTCAEETPLDWSEALRQLDIAKGEVFDPWLVDLFAEEIERNPPVCSDREVMIVPSGSLPWRTVDCDDEEDAVLELNRELNRELEVMLDDFPFEERP